MGVGALGRGSRWEYLRRIHPRYKKASREEKGRILDEFCAVTRYNRKYALRLLGGLPPERVPPARRRRRPTYGLRAVQVLAGIWEAAGYPWSVRLKALLPTWLPWARKRYGISPKTEADLLKISSRQIDRRLADHKKRVGRRIYGRTKPGSLLKHHIPIKTDSWDVKVPGYTEIDLVSHSGDCASGEFIHSLNLTDIHSSWNETYAVMGKSQIRVQQALQKIRHDLPFELRGIDSDNGSEFLNFHLVHYCRAETIQFTRGRPYKKDDNAHVEQKNWTHVRKILGYERYDSDAALAAINRLYRGDLRLLQNLFLPSVKLIRKVRIGSKLRRRYDTPKTPFERLQACRAVRPDVMGQLKSLRDRLDPFELSRSVNKQLDLIYAYANHRRSPARPRAVEAAGPVENRQRPRFPTRTLDDGKQTPSPTAPTAPYSRVTSLVARR